MALMDPKILVKHLRQMLLKHPPQILIDIRHKYSQTFGTNTQTFDTNIYKPFAISILQELKSLLCLRLRGKGERDERVRD